MKRKIKVAWSIVVIGIIAIALMTAYVVYDYFDNEESKFYGTWSYVYPSGNNSLEPHYVNITFYDNDSCYTNDTGFLLGPEWSTWEWSRGYLWNEYEDIDILRFDPWITLPVHPHTNISWAAISKVGIEFIGENHFILISPGNELYSFWKVAD